MARLLALVAAFAVLAVLVPRIAPGILAGFADADAPAETLPAVAGSTSAKPSLSPRSVALDADSRGHFLADVQVNGRRIAVMVDTGATMVALNETTAVRLGINPPRSAFTAPVSTVNGIVKAAPVVLGEIRLNGIVLRGIPAIVVPGTLLETNLLGMSFLGKLSRFAVAGNRMVLVE